MSQAHRLVAALAGALVAVASAGGVDAAPRRRAAHTARAAKRMKKPAPSVSDDLVARTRAAASNPGRTVLGEIRFVTEKRAYLDRGARDGLAVSQQLQLTRGARPFATCKVDTVSEHEATCIGARARVGDTFRPPGGSRESQAAPPALAPLVDEATLAARARELAETAYEKVDFTGERRTRSRSSATLTPGVAVWQSRPDPSGNYAQERLDGAISVLDLVGTGARFDAQFSAQRWNNPSALDRFRTGTASQFYLWQAEVSRRREEGGTVFAVGRLWPWHLPGVTLLDGVQLGQQNASRTMEGGVYGGTIPTAPAIAPSGDLWTGGAYGSLVQTGRGRALFRLAREEARVGIWHSAARGVVAEAELLGQTWLGPWSVAGGGRLRLAPAFSSRPVVERGYLDVGFRPALVFAGSAHVRYFGAPLSDEAVLRAVTPTLAGGVHAAVDARWDVSSWLAVGAFGGAHRDGDSGRHQIYGAAELRLPRCLGDAGGVSGGAEAQQGWLRGRTVYLQGIGRAGRRVQVLARLSASATSFETPAVTENLRELGGYLSIDATAASWLRLRAWSLLRLPYSQQDEPPPNSAVSLVFGSSLTGTF